MGNKLDKETKNRINASQYKDKVIEFLNIYGRDYGKNIEAWIDKTMDDEITSVTYTTYAYPSHRKNKQEVKGRMKEAYEKNWKAHFEAFTDVQEVGTRLEVVSCIWKFTCPSETRGEIEVYFEMDATFDTIKKKWIKSVHTQYKSKSGKPIIYKEKSPPPRSTRTYTEPSYSSSSSTYPSYDPPLSTTTNSFKTSTNNFDYDKQQRERAENERRRNEKQRKDREDRQRRDRQARQAYQRQQRQAAEREARYQEQQRQFRENMRRQEQAQAEYRRQQEQIAQQRYRQAQQALSKRLNR